MYNEVGLKTDLVIITIYNEVNSYDYYGLSLPTGRW